MNEEIVGKLADSYSAYLKMDNHKEMNSLEESIEETLTRLEELENGIKMMQAEREKFNSCDFSAARSNLNALCQRIHKLDEMSKQVLQNVESLATVVDEAETNLLGNTEEKLKNMLKPLLFMKSNVTSSPTNSTASAFTPHVGFQASSFFPKQNEDVSSASH